MDINTIREAAQNRILFLPHAIRQMSRPDRMISTEEVRKIVFSGEIIEDYPEDPRGPSVLLSGIPMNRAIHIVCSPKKEYLAIITAYIPDPDLWSSDFRERKP